MNTFNNIDEILKKVEEIRGFFKIGDEIIPFLGDLFIFIKDVMPLLSEVNASMKDSTKKLPTASDKISIATETAESATHEIMDKLDSITGKLATLSKTMNGEGKILLRGIETDVMDAIYALQFQDITSQQLEHANRILAAIYEKFSVLFNSIESVKSTTIVGDEIIRAIENGIDEQKRNRDKKEFNEKTKDVMRHETISQDDIDQLFS